MKDSYRDLVAWQKAMALVDIVEGKGRLSKKEFVQMLSRARGSVLEVQTQLEIARNLSFLTEENFLTLS